MSLKILRYTWVLNLVCGNICSADLWPSPLDVHAGNYAIIVSSEAHIESEGELLIETLLRWLAAEREAEKFRRKLIPDETMTSEWLGIRQGESLLPFLAVCKETAGTDAGLTAILMTAHYVRSAGFDSKGKRPIQDALVRLRSVHPETWQGQIAPLIEVGMLAMPIDRNAIENALSLLKSNLTTFAHEKQFASPACQTFMKFAGIEPPVQSAVLASIARLEETAAVFRFGNVKLHLSNAVEACTTIMQKYPDSIYSKNAKLFLDHRLADIRKRIESGTLLSESEATQR